MPLAMAATMSSRTVQIAPWFVKTPRLVTPVVITRPMPSTTRNSRQRPSRGSTRAGRGLAVPDLLHREQAGLRQPGAAPDGGEQADDQPNRAGTLKGVHVARELAADDRELMGDASKRGPFPFEHRSLQRRVVSRDEPENRDEHQEQRENRDKGGMSQRGGHNPAVVIGELLGHPDHEGDRGVPLLGRIQPPRHALDRIHWPHLRSTPRLGVPSSQLTGAGAPGFLTPLPARLARRANPAGWRMA